MFGKRKNLSELRKGLELSLTMSLFGIPEVLVVHIKYDDALRRILQELAQYKIQLIILSLDSETVCEDCASIYIRELIDKAYPDAKGIASIKFFGIKPQYANEVAGKVNASC